MPATRTTKVATARAIGSALQACGRGGEGVAACLPLRGAASGSAAVGLEAPAYGRQTPTRRAATPTAEVGAASKTATPARPKALPRPSRCVGASSAAVRATG